MILFSFFIVPFLFTVINAQVFPIEVRGHQFIDTKTNQPFLIKGVDYQPGGSSAYIGREDPLSDIDTCARDVFLFQLLGINVR
jgi:hypothetical protein